jgi:hypothetical protein
MVAINDADDLQKKREMSGLSLHSKKKLPHFKPPHLPDFKLWRMQQVRWPRLATAATEKIPECFERKKVDPLIISILLQELANKTDIP